jgi:ubiquinone/menaquinone biosynthesis C-methylase UbiE
MTPAARQYLYVAPDLHHVALFDDATLAQTTERHPAIFDVPPLQSVADIAAELRQSQAGGIVFGLAEGLPSARHLQLVAQTLGSDRRTWIYWPAEQAVECVDAERLQSLRRHVSAVQWLKRICQPVDRAITRWHRLPTGLRWIYRGEFPVRRSDIFIKLNLLSLRAQPVAFDPPPCGETPFRAPAVGVYLRTDYWASSDRDPGTSRVARELAAIGERVVCLTPRRDPWLDEAGVQQVVMDGPRQTDGQDAIVLAPTHYEPIVKAACQALRPAYLYERLSAGESVGAELSQILSIPYIVEHPGPEALLQEALGGAAPFYSELYSQAEELALRQATMLLVGTQSQKLALVSRGIDASRVLVEAGQPGMGERLAAFIAARTAAAGYTASIQTGDAYKDQVQKQWNYNPVGSQHARESQPHTLEWFLEVEKHRYGTYAPWMPETMEVAAHAGHDVLEIGGGMGTDLAQFAAHGAVVTDLDLSAGHLQLAEENLRLRGLGGRFIHHDAEALPFDDGSFDVVYSNGVLHHTPNTVAVVREIHRVLRPGGRAIVMVYAENSLHYWRKLVWGFGVKKALLDRVSMAEIMSRSVERSANEAKPLVKVYTKPRLRALFKDFVGIEILQRQLLAEELPGALRWTLPASERWLGWNLILKATKP